MFVVLEDGWIPHKFCDTVEEAQAEVRRCRLMYQGGFSYRPCRPDYVRRFCRAVGL